ncbi:hypothetical protein FRC12_012182 [Ceratobasidium sp. 428]|nr:hypothetical protein FRC12_012182 [Ceratobasidium sp. 428]
MPKQPRKSITRRDKRTKSKQPKKLEPKDYEIVVLLGNCKDEHLTGYTQPNGKRSSLGEKSFEGWETWVAAKPNDSFSVHVSYDGISPPYPDIGWLNITVYFDGTRVSDGFIYPDQIALRAEQKLSKRADGLRIKRIGKKRKLTEEQMNNLEAPLKDGEFIFGETEISCSPGDGGVVKPFCFAPRQPGGGRTVRGSAKAFGQILIEARWAKVTIGLPGSMKELYPEVWGHKSKRFVNQHRLSAALGPEMVCPDIKLEREAEGGYRFRSEPLDDMVYRFMFYYAEESTLIAQGFTRD